MALRALEKRPEIKWRLRKSAHACWSAACTGASWDTVIVLGAANPIAISARADDSQHVCSWCVWDNDADADSNCLCASQAAASLMTKQQTQRHMAPTSLQRTSFRTGWISPRT